MTFRCYGKPYEAADMSSTVPKIFQKFTLDTDADHKALKTVIAGIIAHNPSFTSLVAEIWSDNGGSPGKLISQSSNSKSRSDLLTGTDNYSLGWYRFNFSPVPLRAGASYHVALRASGYTYSDSAHLAWMRGFPDPQYREGITLQVTKLLSHPFDLGILTGRL